MRKHPLFYINLIAFIISIAWLLKIPGFESLITTLTLLAALIGQIIAIKNKKDTQSNKDLSFAEPEDKTVTMRSKSQEKIILYTESPNPNNWTAISFYDFVKILKDESITDLQKQHLVEKYSGKRARWKGVIKDITTMSNRDPQSDILVVFHAPEDTDLFPILAVATFKSESKHDLLSLSDGDLIEMEGTIATSSLGSEYSARFNDAIVISYIKK